jgi:hypothetical protein
MILLKGYAKQIVPLFFDFQLSLNALSQALFEKVPGLKQEYEKRYQDAKKQAEKSTQSAVIETILRSIEQIGQILQTLYEAQGK